VPDDWSVQVTTGTPSPSIVITNVRYYRIDQLSIGILSQKSLEIFEIQVYSSYSHLTGSFLTVYFITFGCMIVHMFYDIATAVQPNRTRWIESLNAQGG
jgi:hypothetical protein